MGKKQVLCILALVITLGLAGCSSSKEVQKDSQKVKEAVQVQIVYRIVSQDPTKEEIEDTSDKLRMRAEAYDSGVSVELREADRLIVSFSSEVGVEELAEELAVPGILNFITEDGAAVLNGGDIASAEVHTQQSGNQDLQNNWGTNEEVYDVRIKFTEAGARLFSEVTQNNIGKHISIVCDGKVLCSPVVHDAVTQGEVIINEAGSKEEAERLARKIRIGELPLELEVYEIVRE